VGDGQVAAPALRVETVAAGGGSICDTDGQALLVGPRSAGAEPGPACYGAGGPLTVTDVNLLLGRLDGERFGIPIDRAAAERALAEVAARLRHPPTRDALLVGFLRIANERMADAVRRISVREGYDPRRAALLAFGGAGAQHACDLAELLGMSTVLVPADASGTEAVANAFAAAYRDVYGYEPPPRSIEIEALRVVAAEREPERVLLAADSAPRQAVPAESRKVHLETRWLDIAAFERSALVPGDTFVGPCLVFEEHSATLVGEGWRGQCDAARALRLERVVAAAPSPS